ncbi:endonuclease domain-containing protein [Amnibacterium endophyticum]|uniref:Endonuclease domain-containing protein n=1 Tax=Amnibacterium endophyticum TaxID=2109337 RepID=A0ABW4LBJ8_9MICO
MQNDDWSRADAIALGVLERNGGVARIDAFLAAGLTRHQVAAIFRRGVLDRPRNAWFVDPALPWQAKHAIRVGGILACLSAAASYGLPVPPEAWRRIHVLVPHNAPRRRHNRDKRRYVAPDEDLEVELHWSPDDGMLPGWRTSLVETLVAMSACVPLDWWIAAIDAARHRPRDRPALLDAQAFRRLRALVPGRLVEHLGLVDALSGSCIETLLRLGLIRRGIGPFVLQFSPTANEFVDFLLPGKLIVEVDGEAFHDPQQDALRDARFRGLGYRVLRFTYSDVVDRLDQVLDQIQAALAALAAE